MMSGKTVLGIALILMLSGCSHESTTINTSQSLIMESSVFSAGIVTTQPVISGRAGQQRAFATLSNQQETPVTLHYRFYWYDDRGLEVLPWQHPGVVVVPPQRSVEIASQTGNLTASQVRLYLYL